MKMKNSADHTVKETVAAFDPDKVDTYPWCFERWKGVKDWFPGKIVNVNTTAGTHDVAYDADEDTNDSTKMLEARCVLIERIIFVEDNN